MKTLRYLLALSALLSLASAGRAATPTYNSFNTNQFYTNGSAPILINVVTNWPTLIVTNIYSSNIYVTNIYATNIFASNIVSGDIVWTNAGPYITPLPFTNKLQITLEGSILSGASVWPWWAPDDDDAFISVSDEAQGETGVRKLYMAAVDDATAPVNYSSVRLQALSGFSPSAQFTLASTLGVNTSRLVVNVQPDANVANIQLYNNGNLNFAVNDTSGYSGTGTNFLSDDGSYKPGTGTTINPTDNFIPYRLDGATFDDSPMYRIDANTVGVDTVDANTLAATNLQSGGVIYSRSDGILTNVVNGTGFLFNDGSNTNLVWAGGSISDICLWTNKAGLLQPVDATLPVGWTNQLRLGPSFANILYGTNIFLSYTNPTAYSGYEANSGDGSVARYLAGGNLAVIQGTSGVELNDGFAAPNAIRWNANRLLTLKTNSVFGGGQSVAGSSPIGIVNVQTNLIWGFMETIDTNYSRLAISHSGTNGYATFASQGSGTAGTGRDFLFTNDLAATTINVANTNGALAGYGLDSGGNALVTAASGKSVKFGPDNTAEIYFASPSGFYPNSTNLSLGLLGVSTRWGDLQQAGTFYNYGHLSGTGSTNYARLAISVTGTNASDRIVLNSQSSGAAGSAGRPFAFTNAPIVLPTFTKAQKATLTTQEGMILFQTDNTPGIRVYQSGAWVMVSTVADP